MDEAGGEMGRHGRRYSGGDGEWEVEGVRGSGQRYAIAFLRLKDDHRYRTFWGRHMLPISSSAITAFERNETLGFVDQLAEFLIQTIPLFNSQPVAALAEEVRPVVADAKAHGFKSEQGIAAFVVTAALLGPKFYKEFNGARQIVESNAPEEEKALLLEFFTTQLFANLEGY